MKIRERIVVFIKSLRQVGIVQLCYYVLYKAGLVSGYFKWIESSFNSKSVAIHAIQSSQTVPHKEKLASILGVEGRKKLLREAEEILHGSFRPFGGQPAKLEFGFNQPLEHWTVYERYPEKLAQLISPIIDIKFTWEPARFGWAFALGRAYALTGEDRYAQSFLTLFDQFESANPPYLGPNWMNGQEVAIRLMALQWVVQVFENAPGFATEKKSRLLRSLETHARRIPSTLVYARAQNNNHLVTESAALYGAGVALSRRDWCDLGWRWLNWSIQHQIGGYGEYIQHSTNYHRLMLQACLWATTFLRTEGGYWPVKTSQALARATHWLFSVLDPITGYTPNLGANDGALILPLSACDQRDHRPSVQAAARAFLRSQLPAGPWDELATWLGFEAVEKTNTSDDYLMDNLHGRDSWAYLRASRFRSRLSHMDQLHLDLWWKGENIATDAGTFVYQSQSPWDNPFVTTRVHNSVMVDGRDQMKRGGRFLTLDWFPTYSKTLIESDENILQKVIGYHKGYRGIRHERTVTVYVDDHWLVEDLLRSKSAHRYRLHWLLPDWEWKLVEPQTKTEIHLEGITIRLHSPNGWITLVVDVTPRPPDLRSCLCISRAGEKQIGSCVASPIDGWMSPTYGIKMPALSVAVELVAEGEFKFSSEFNLKA